MQIQEQRNLPTRRRVGLLFIVGMSPSNAATMMGAAGSVRFASTSNKQSGKTRGLKDRRRVSWRRGKHRAEEEEEAAAMAMAPGGTEGSRRLWAKGRGKEREARDGWAGWTLACWASVADYHIYIGWFLAHRESDGLI
jgi:hypothetical protein